MYTHNRVSQKNIYISCVFAFHPHENYFIFLKTLAKVEIWENSVSCLRVYRWKLSFRFPNATLCDRKWVDARCATFLCATVKIIMDAVRVVLLFMFMQMLFACLYLQTQLLHYAEEPRRKNALRSAVLQQLSLPRRRLIACHCCCCRFWIRPGRPASWWENFEKEVVLSKEWRENFRMSSSSLLLLSELPRPHIEGQMTFRLD